MNNANKNWNQLIEDHEIAYLRADICLGSSQSYSLEEKKRIYTDMEASTAAIDAALRADSESLPLGAQGMLLDMLCASGCMTPEFWKETLIGKTLDVITVQEARQRQSE